MVLVPGGPFAMGPDRREVHLDAFYLDRTPVTNREFATFVDGHRLPARRRSRRRASSHHFRGGQGAVRARASTRWSTCRGTTRAPTRRGPASGSPPRPSGRRRRAAPTAASTPGAAPSPGRRAPTTANCAAGRRRWARIPEGASPYGIARPGGQRLGVVRGLDDPRFYADGPSHNPRNATPRQAAASSCAAARGCTGRARCARSPGRATRRTTASRAVASAARGARRIALAGAPGCPSAALPGVLKEVGGRGR